MIGTTSTLRRIAVVVVAAAAFAAPVANATAPSGYTFITDTLGGNGHPKSVQTYRVITDTLGGNGRPRHVQTYRVITDTLGGNGGPLPELAAPRGGFRWTDAGIGALAATGAVLVLLGSTLVVVRRRSHLTV